MVFRPAEPAAKVEVFRPAEPAASTSSTVVRVVEVLQPAEPAATPAVYRERGREQRGPKGAATSVIPCRGLRLADLNRTSAAQSSVTGGGDQVWNHGPFVFDVFYL